MIKVCHITSVHSRYDGRIFQKECRSLSKAGYKVVLLVNDDREREVCDGVTIVPVHCPGNRIKRIMTSANKMYDAAKKINAAIYHIHDPELLPLAGRLRRYGRHVIYDSHEFYYFQIKQKHYLPKAIRFIAADLYRWYEKRILCKIDAVVTPCTLSGKNYFEGIAKKTVFIDNRPERSCLHTKDYEKKPLPISCCYIGSLARERGIMEMLSATENTGTAFILAGDMEFRLRTELGKGLTAETLDFRGYVDRKEVQKIYDEAWIGFSLLHNAGQYGVLDNMPTKVYEYMLAGIPIIMSRRSYSEQFIAKYPVGILVNPEDLQEIEAAIIYLKEHLEEAKKMGETGRKAILEDLCWEKEAGKLVELYSRLLTSGHNAEIVGRGK